VGHPARAGAFRRSDADRKIVVGMLRAAWLEGRLGLADFEQRVSAAVGARTYAEADALVADVAQPEPPLPVLAGWWRRSAALAVDHVLLLAGVLALAALVGGVAVLAVPVLGVAYFTVAQGSRSGRTIGERIFGIAVRSARAHGGRRATHGEAFGRAPVLYVALGVFLRGGVLNFMSPLWDGKRQAGWHDKAADTVVMRARSYPFERRRWLRRWRMLRRA
jgi:uncharacterized RDD family membrane protein YckC